MRTFEHLALENLPTEVSTSRSVLQNKNNIS